MQTDNTDWVNMDFRITQTKFLSRRVQSTSINTDEVTWTDEIARDSHAIYSFRCTLYIALLTRWLFHMELSVH